jgi:hypothetical protein
MYLLLLGRLLLQILGIAAALFVLKTVRQMDNTTVNRGTAYFKVSSTVTRLICKEYLVSFTQNALRNGSNCEGQLILRWSIPVVFEV